MSALKDSGNLGEKCDILKCFNELLKKNLHPGLEKLTEQRHLSAHSPIRIYFSH